jgi:hypothetical protein
MKRKNLAHIFTAILLVTMVLGAILMLGGNHLGDLIVISSAIGITATLAIS